MKPDKVVEKLMEVCELGEAEARALVKEALALLMENKRKDKVKEILNELSIGGKKK